MSYAIEVLEKEMKLLTDCLSEWQLKDYPEAREERNKKVKNIVKSIEYLKSNKI